MKRIKALIAALAIGGALVAASPAMAADNNTVHLDVQGGYTSQSGNLQNYRGIFNVQGTLSKEVNSKLTVFGTLGEAFVGNSKSVIEINRVLVGVPTVGNSQTTFNVGGQLNFSPVTFVRASFGQRPSDLYVNNVNARSVRELTISAGTRLF